MVTDDEAADAYTLPGLPCRIVITAGMLRALTGPERQVLLAHERAHASGVHYLFTTAARLAAAANPLLRPVASAVGYSVERWADERAAAVTGDRELAARAIARAALAATAAPPRPAGRAASALGAVSIQLPARQVIGSYARRMNIEQRLAEAIQSFSLDALAGAVLSTSTSTSRCPSWPTPSAPRCAAACPATPPPPPTPSSGGS